MKTVFNKIIERLKEETFMVATSKDFYVNPQNGEFVEEVVTIKNAIEIIEEARKYDNDWILVSDRLPEILEYYKPFWVTIHTRDSRCKDFYYVSKVTWNQYHKRWESDSGKPISNRVDIVAWREYDMPAPYQPKE